MVRSAFFSLLFICLLNPCNSLAQNDPLLAEQTFQKGHGSVALFLQMIEVHEFNTGADDVDIGNASTRSAYFQFDYAVSDRWLLSFGLPYIKKKFDGAPTHDPLALEPPRPDVPFLDDGQYHGYLQDLLFGVHYLWSSQPLLLQPFVNVLIPSHEYPHFAQAAVGQNLWKVEMGLELTHYLPFSDWYYRLAGSYTVVEQTIGVNVNHFRLNGKLGYFLSPRMSANVFFQAKDGRGDKGTKFPPSNRTGEPWYQHDRTSKHSYLNLGMGTDWLLGEHYELSASVLTTVWGDTVHLVDWAASLGITRFF